VKRTPVKDRRQRKARGSSGRTTILLSIVVVFSVLGILLVAAPFALAFAAYSYAAGALNSLSVTSHQATFQTSRIYDRNGKLLYEFVDPTAGRRTEVPLQQIPVSLRDATIAIEDKTFYTNPGFDVNGILRAAYDDIVHHRIVSGASTITEQLVKQVYLTPAVNLQRKLKEVAIAYTLSKEKTKDQILQMYLNQIFYGNDAVGIEAAAESYFGIPAIKLDLAQSALLAGLPQSPTAYDPLQNLQRAKVRQLEVLNQMVDQGYVTDQQAQAAYNEKLNFAKQTQAIQAPHFVFYVRDLLEQKYGARFLYQGGLRITTTLDLNLQNQAQQIVQKDLSATELTGKNVNNAAVVAIDPHTGEILAMVGSRDYNQEFPNGTMDGKFNAALAPLQPGSSFKPFAYVTDFLKGRTAATIWDDSKVTDEFPNFDGTYYRPVDYDGKYHGKVTARVALANSLNVPAVKVLKDATIHSTLQTAHAMGISTINDESNVGLSLVLGGNAVTLLDMTSAYGVFANQGARVPAQAILSITDSSGKVIQHYTPPPPAQVIPPAYAYLISSILSDDSARCSPQVCEFGRHSVLELPDRPAAVKTGTTDLFKANWTIGYTPNLVVGVWAGNSNNASMRNVIGIDGAGPIWHDVMEAALKGTPAQNFTKPPNIVTVRVSSITGLLPNPGEPSYEEVFVKGTEPTTRSTYLVATPSRDQLIATATAVSAFATARAEGTTVPAGVSLTPPAIPTLAQTPTPLAAASGTPTPTAPPGSQATVVINTAPAQATVPGVVGMTQAQAAAALQSAGLNTGALTYNNQGSVAVGQVSAQSPAAGTKLAPGSPVALTIRGS